MSEALETAPQDVEDVNILKPKRKNNMSDEARKKASENMKRVNAERIERARIENEGKLQAEEEKIKVRAEMKLAEVKKKQENIKNAKEKNLIPLPEKKVELAQETTPPPDDPKDDTKKIKKQLKKKRIIVESSSSEDSMDYYDNDSSASSESECEIVYVSKKSKKQSKGREKHIAKPDTIVKEKKPKPQIQQPLQEIPKTIIKFL
jgi:phage-related minor tail protein